MSKRVLPILGAVGAIALFLASCGGGDDPASEQAALEKRRGLAGQTQGSVAPQLSAAWTELSSAAVPTSAGGPGARVWTEMTWDSARSEIVLFGGNGPQLYDNDIWSYRVETGAWTLIDPFTYCPGNDGFTKLNGTDDTNFKYDPINNLFWAFGGVSGYRCISFGQARTAAVGSGPTVVVDPALSSNVDGEYTGWYVNTSNGTARVIAYAASTRTLTLGTAVPALTAGTAYRLYATNGAGVWYYDPVSGKWTGQGVAPGDTTSIPTQGRIAAAVDYSSGDHAFVLWGGLSMGTDRRVWKLDVTTKQWTALPIPATGAPAHRREMLNSFVYDKANDVFILFGGICSYAYDPGCPESSVMGETWVYRLSTNTWVNMNPPTAPSPRAQQVMAYDDEHGVVVLFGGSTTTGDTNDTWVYHYPSNSWSRLAPATAPASRRLAQIAYNPLTRQTILFGGSVAGIGLSGDIWALRLTNTGSGNTPPSVGLTSPAAGATYTAPASITLSANASDSDGSVARVEFYAGATKIGEATSAPYQMTWTGVAAGSYSLSARATDNQGASTNSAAVAVSVAPPANVAPSVSLISPAAGATYTAPASITLSANASDSDGSIAKVEFYAGATKIGERTAAPYTLAWSNVAAGSYSLTAVATDNVGARTTSAAVGVTVSPPANVAPSVSLISPAAGATYTAPASITLSANASDSDGSIARVEFYAGSTKIGERTAAPYTLAWSSVAAGSYSLTAVATDNAGASTVSAVVGITVNPPAGGGGSINVAAQVNGGVASASSTYSSAFPVAAVNDGNRLGNRWAQGGGWNDASSSSFPDWVQVNFAGTRSINRIEVFTLPDNYAAGEAPTPSTTFSLYGITDFTVQTWNGAAWVTVPGGSVIGNNLVWRSFSFPAVSTDRIRITVNKALYWYSRILEIEAWSE